MIDWIMRRPFARQHSNLSSMLIAVGFVVVLMIVEPPLLWLFGWLLKPIFRVLTWWWVIWQ